MDVYVSHSGRDAHVDLAGEIDFSTAAELEPLLDGEAFRVLLRATNGSAPGGADLQASPIVGRVIERTEDALSSSAGTLGRRST